MSWTATSDQASPFPPQAAVDAQEIEQILQGHDGERGGLIAALEQIQSRYGYLPEDALRMVSQQTGRSLVDIFGVATFYRAFSLVPRGKHLVCACQGTACHVRGASRIVEGLERELGAQPGQTTPDGLFTLETVNCLGACAMGPMVVIDGRYFSKVRTPDIRRMLDAALTVSVPADGGLDGSFPIETSCPLCNHSLMDAGTLVDGLPSMRMIIASQDAVGLCNYSALLGSGGALCQVEIVDRSVCELFCPHCHESLPGDWTCESCGAAMARLAVKGGGMVYVCRRRGCPGQRLDLECVNR